VFEAGPSMLKGGAKIGVWVAEEGFEPSGLQN